MARKDPRKRKQKSLKTGTTWTSSSGKIIQADASRNKGRMFKEKAGQNIANVRGRQKARKNLRQTNVKGLAKQGVNWFRKKLNINKKKK